MSYLVKKRRYRGRPAMGGFAEFFENIADELWKTDTAGGTKTETNECLAQANAQTAQLDAKASDLSKNWNPSGFYSPTQIEQLVNATYDVIQRGLDAVTREQAENIDSEYGGGKQQMQGEINGLNAKIADGRKYLDAARTARLSSITAVNAPGLKDYVVKAMLKASSAMNAAYLLACLRPWWAGIYQAFATAFNALWSLAKAIVGVAVDVGTAVIKVAGELPSIVNVLVWGGIAFGAYYLYTQLQSRRSLTSPP